MLLTTPSRPHQSASMRYALHPSAMATASTRWTRTGSLGASAMRLLPSNYESAALPGSAPVPGVYSTLHESLSDGSWAVRSAGYTWEVGFVPDHSQGQVASSDGQKYIAGHCKKLKNFQYVLQLLSLPPNTYCNTRRISNTTAILCSLLRLTGDHAIDMTDIKVEPHVFRNAVD
jgi:hypothetical protein